MSCRRVVSAPALYGGRSSLGVRLGCAPPGDLAAHLGARHAAERQVLAGVVLHVVAVGQQGGGLRRGRPAPHAEERRAHLVALERRAERPEVGGRLEGVVERQPHARRRAVAALDLPHGRQAHGRGRHAVRLQRPRAGDDHRRPVGCLQRCGAGDAVRAGAARRGQVALARGAAAHRVRPGEAGTGHGRATARRRAQGDRGAPRRGVDGDEHGHRAARRLVQRRHDLHAGSRRLDGPGGLRGDRAERSARQREGEHGGQSADARHGDLLQGSSGRPGRAGTAYARCHRRRAGGR